MAKKKKTSSTQESLFGDELYTEKVPDIKQEQKVNPDAQFYDKIGLVGRSDKSFGDYIESINKSVRITTMEDDKLFPQLARHYKHIYDHISKPEIMMNTERVMDYVKLQNVHNGVCYYARVKLGTDVEEHRFMKMFLKGPHLYWCPPPRLAKNGLEVVSSIGLRLNYLEQIVKILEHEKTR